MTPTTEIPTQPAFWPVGSFTPGWAAATGRDRRSSSWISKSPNVCGGDACIRFHRIPVWVLANYRRLGGPDASILHDYPALTLEDLDAAWEYEAEHQEEIDRAIRENEEGEAPVE